MQEDLLLLITGGTFDKEYNYLNGELYFKDSHVPAMLERGRCTLNTTVRTLMMIDSTEMTDSDRELIVHNCTKAVQQHIIITHGTDTMVQTATRLAEAKIENKTIVITGAMIPYTFGTSSDGFFNLGSALAFVQVLQPGVYVCMNGQYFNWNEVEKNRQTGYFQLKIIVKPF
jgi:L-asparaginase